MPFANINFDPSPGATSRLTIGSSSNRVALIIYPPIAGQVTIANDPIAVSGQGLVLAAAQAPLELYFDIHGDIVRREFHCLYAGGPQPIGWIEVFP